MEYTVKQLADTAGVSVRTLHWYDAKGLLRPARKTQAGYRVYTEVQVDILQQIMFCRALEMPLDEIKRVISSDGFDLDTSLARRREALVMQRDRINTLIDTLDKTVKSRKGDVIMTDKEKFEGFKQAAIDKNEAAYGAETRQKYGDSEVDASNKKFKNMTQQQYDEMTALGAEINARLEAAVKNGASPSGEEGREIAQMHKKWLTFTWQKYTPEAHKGVAQMYIADDRFTACYDKNIKGCAKFLCDAVVENM
ncbi:MAG: MerR family transcriptional regulator [Clostridia bacterium]|jgi:MerR family transcriptional regulator, thiopeptide resistance regulator|nr:MerR family transcriptional regulator [Clostridia bacterium]NLS85484.1 MerR family transcriptional regulator [Oscillospiraceae bacterium]